MPAKNRRIALESLDRASAEAVLFDRLWDAVRNTDPSIRMSPIAAKMVEAVRLRIAEKKPLSQTQPILPIVLAASDPDSDQSRPVFLGHRMLWFYGTVGEFVERHGNRVVPLSLAIEALCNASQYHYGRTSSGAKGRTFTLTSFGEKALGLSGSIRLPHDVNDAEPSDSLDMRLEELYGDDWDPYCERV